MTYSKIIIIFSYFFIVNSSYSEDLLLRVYITNEVQNELFVDNQLPVPVSLWNEINFRSEHIDLQVESKYAQTLKNYLTDQEMSYEILSDDIQMMVNQHLQSQNQVQDLRDYSESGWNYTYYMPLEKINQWLDSKLKDCGAKCSKISVGKSYEGRGMFALKISTGPGAKNKKGIWLDGGIHAREWISPASVMYVTDQLVHSYQKNDEVTELVDNFDWYILPVLNVDGYAYTWVSNETRLWRKTRTPNVGSSCIGKDPNRNFDFQWNVTGTSGDPCSDIYSGPKPFSENVTRTLTEYLRSKPKDFFDVFLTIHSYGQLIMAPWGYTDESPSNYDELMQVGMIGKRAAFEVHGMNYTVGSTGKVLYQNSGTSRDWAKGFLGIRWVYTFELRDNGTYGFVLPPDQIKPTAEEFWAAVKAMMKEVLNRRVPVASTGTLASHCFLVMTATILIPLLLYKIMT